MAMAMLETITVVGGKMKNEALTDKTFLINQNETLFGTEFPMPIHGATAMIINNRYKNI